jgi:hypothetical protein
LSNVTPGSKQTITIQTLAGTALVLRITRAGQHAVTHKARVGSSGVYHYAWTVSGRLGAACVKVTATHGWETKMTNVHFTIR